MALVRVKRGTLTLPPETLQIVGTDAQFTVITTGDTIILKKITPPASPKLRNARHATRQWH